MEWGKVEIKNIEFFDVKKVVFLGKQFESKRVLFNGKDDGVTIFVKK
jgi:hypothetical protein